MERARSDIHRDFLSFSSSKFLASSLVLRASRCMQSHCGMAHCAPPNRRLLVHLLTDRTMLPYSGRPRTNQRRAIRGIHFLALRTRSRGGGRARLRCSSLARLLNEAEALSAEVLEMGQQRFGLPVCACHRIHHPPPSGSRER